MRLTPRSGFLALVVVALLALGSCKHEQAEQTRPTSARVAEGHRLAEVYCSTCHAIGATGESRHPMAPPFRTLSRDYPVTALQDAFAQGVLVGHPDMPEFNLDPDQIDSLLAYLQSIQQRQGG
jgi:cytochrome c